VNVLVVTGSRHGCTAAQRIELRRAIASSDCDCVLHGNAEGVDREADDLAHEFDKNIIRVPALWTSRGNQAGPIRNSFLVTVAAALRDAGNHVHFAAFPSADPKGTKDCIRKLKSAHIGGSVTAPDG
jgi:hypothetical protein